MVCQLVPVPGGGNTIVCGGGPRKRCACGRSGTLLCDWKVPGRRSGTCDVPICAQCTTSPAPEKDLCPKHAREFEAWKASRNEGEQH